MCGIYGIAKSPTPYTRKDLKLVKKVLRDIAVDSETRGSHSSGIAKVGEHTRIYKSLLPSSKFVDTWEYSTAVNSLKGSSNILLGHTRFATEGAIVKSNAHPFKVGDVVGAHNGCVYNIKEMSVKLDKTCPVDSQLIFKSINDSKNIEDAVKNFDADFALSFVKKDTNVLYLTRENNRPLFVAYIPSLKTLFYASEENFIEDALVSNGINDIDVYSLSKNTLYAFNTTKFDSIKTNVVKTQFKYDSRVYQFNMNNYSSTTYLTDDDEWEAIIPQSYIEDEKKSLSDLYGGEPDEWFWDDIEQDWMYMDSATNQIFTEEQVATMQYYDEIDESEVANELL
jgi:glucosamine 6-phosphate synthetase-like amidotransferase/phosphosugar isomerase protein